MPRRLMVLLCCSVVGCGAGALRSPARIVLDGRFADWDAKAPVAGEALDTGTASGLGRLWIANDEYSLLVRFEVMPESNVQAGNELELCLDTDNDAATGRPVHGTGAELCWRFGDRRGTVVGAAGESEIEHQHIGMITAPTVTGTDFEIGLALGAEPAGVPLFPTDTIRLILLDGVSGTVVPAATGGARYTLSHDAPPPLAPIDIARNDAGHIRFLSYNLNNHLMDPARRTALARVLNAIDADVILLQEIRDTPTEAAVRYVRDLFERGGETWHTVKVGGESTVVFSSFPILRADSLGDSGGLVLQLGGGDGVAGQRGGEYDNVLLLVALSMPCCNEQARRSAEADLIAGYVRDAKSGAGKFRIPEGTPIVLMGDANLVGLRQDRRVLQYGEIVDSATYGRGELPDWDDTPLADLVPRNTHRPQTFTWHGEDFPPGRLDYVFYSDSELAIGNRFLLHTPSVPGEVLSRWGLEADDTDTVTDHLPVVADLILTQ